MKNLICILIALLITTAISAQDSRLLKAADKSFDVAETDYKKKRYDDAAASYEIVIENIEISTDSRKYLIMRFEALTALTDIYFNKSENVPSACRVLNIFIDDLDNIKKSGIFKAKDIFKYLEMEKEFGPYIRKCESFNSIDEKKNDFENIFDKEFEDEDED